MYAVHPVGQHQRSVASLFIDDDLARFKSPLVAEGNTQSLERSGPQVARHIRWGQKIVVWPEDGAMPCERLGVQQESRIGERFTVGVEINHLAIFAIEDRPRLGGPTDARRFEKCDVQAVQ